MSKLDKVLEAAKPIAKETAKLTGKGLVLAGKGIKEAGGKVAEEYKEQKKEQIESKLEELQNRYPEGKVFSVYNVEHISDRKKLTSLGLKKYVREPGLLNFSNLVLVVIDQNNTACYTIHGKYQTELKRRFLVYRQGRPIGIVTEHSPLLSSLYESIQYGAYHLGNLYENLQFSNSKIKVEAQNAFMGNYIVRDTKQVIMEVVSVRGQEFIAVAHPSIFDECIMMYTAVHLLQHQKYSGGGGE